MCAQGCDMQASDASAARLARAVCASARAQLRKRSLSDAACTKHIISCELEAHLCAPLDKQTCARDALIGRRLHLAVELVAEPPHCLP